MARKNIHKSEGLVLLADTSHYGQEVQYLLFLGGVAPGVEMVLSYRNLVSILDKMIVDACERCNSELDKDHGSATLFRGQEVALRELRDTIEKAVKEHSRERGWR